MPGLYIGSTAGYSGKNMIVIGIGQKLMQEGLRVGYMKPVGALPMERDGKLGDEDAFCVQETLGLALDPEVVTPVVVTQDFKVEAFGNRCQGLVERIERSYAIVSEGKDVTLVAGSGSMYSGRYCGVDAVTLVKRLGLKTVVIDRFRKELAYDMLVVLKETLGELMAGVILNDIPADFMDELEVLIAPFFASRGIKIVGVIPKDPRMGVIRVADLADRLGGKIISAHAKVDRMVDNFLIGTMQVENFLTHFRRRRNAAVIVGGDRSDVQLVALEGDCPCLVLTGNLFPNDIILTRAEVLGTPIIVVREDTYSVARKMEDTLARHKLREPVKIRQGAELVAAHLDFAYLRQELGL